MDVIIGFVVALILIDTFERLGDHTKPRAHRRNYRASGRDW